MFRCPKSYLIVDRDFIIEKILNDDSCIYKFTQEDRRIAEIETESKGFYSYNKHALIWKVSFENNALAFINPIIESSHLSSF